MPPSNRVSGAIDFITRRTRMREVAATQQIKYHTPRPDFFGIVVNIKLAVDHDTPDLAVLGVIRANALSRQSQRSSLFSMTGIEQIAGSTNASFFGSLSFTDLHLRIIEKKYSLRTILCRPCKAITSLDWDLAYHLVMAWADTAGEIAARMEKRTYLTLVQPTSTSSSKSSSVSGPLTLRQKLDKLGRLTVPRNVQHAVYQIGVTCITPTFTRKPRFDFSRWHDDLLANDPNLKFKARPTYSSTHPHVSAPAPLNLSPPGASRRPAPPSIDITVSRERWQLAGLSPLSPSRLGLSLASRRAFIPATPSAPLSMDITVMAAESTERRLLGTY